APTSGPGLVVWQGATGVNPNRAKPFVIELFAIRLPEIVVEQPSGTVLTSGLSSVDCGSLPIGGAAQRSFIIRNVGTASLTGLGITITGPNASDFTVTSLPAAPVLAGSSTT